jgi:hypothetical protein
MLRRYNPIITERESGINREIFENKNSGIRENLAQYDHNGKFKKEKNLKIK